MCTPLMLCDVLPGIIFKLVSLVKLTFLCDGKMWHEHVDSSISYIYYVLMCSPDFPISYQNHLAQWNIS
jgi:hypothetical protein